MKVLEFKKKLKTFLKKVTKHKKNYMGGLNSKNKNIKIADPFNAVDGETNKLNNKKIRKFM